MVYATYKCGVIYITAHRWSLVRCFNRQDTTRDSCSRRYVRVLAWYGVLGLFLVCCLVLISTRVVPASAWSRSGDRVGCSIRRSPHPTNLLTLYLDLGVHLHATKSARAKRECRCTHLLSLLGLKPVRLVDGLRKYQQIPG